MKAIKLLHHRKKQKHAKTIKNFDLKYLDHLTNSEQNNIINFKRLNYGSTKNLFLFTNKYINSPKKKDDIEKAKTPEHKGEEKIDNIINNKIINNSLTSNYFFPFKKNYKYKSNEKTVLSEADKTNDNNKIKGNDNKNRNNYINFKTLDGRHISNDDIEKYDLLPHFIKSHKKLNFNKNNFIFNQKMNYGSVFKKTVKHQTAMQSTLPTFSRMISPDKENINKNKDEKFISISKKKLNNFDLSKSKHDNKSEINKFNSLIKYRKNYPFVINPKPLVPKKFYGLPSSVIKMNIKYINILKKENEKVFRQYFSIISKEKFSKKFQNIVNKYETKERNIKYILNKKNEKKEEDNNSQENSLINENIISGVELLKEINNRQIKENEEIKTNKKLLFTKFKKSIIHLSLKIDRLSVYLGEILKTYKKPKNSFSFFPTHDLFFAIKTKNLKLANQILDAYKYIVLDYDYFHMTALHWAAKYNFYQIISKILEYGSFIDKQNYIGETPLLICVKHQFIESSIFLLINLASPFIKDNKGLSSLDYCKNDFKMKNIFNKIASLHYISILGPTKRQFEYVSREFIEYIVNENKGDLELEAYNILKEKYEYYKRKIKNLK